MIPIIAASAASPAIQLTLLDAAALHGAATEVLNELPAPIPTQTSKEVLAAAREKANYVPTQMLAATNQHVPELPEIPSRSVHKASPGNYLTMKPS